MLRKFDEIQDAWLLIRVLVILVKHFSTDSSGQWRIYPEHIEGANVHSLFLPSLLFFFLPSSYSLFHPKNKVELKGYPVSMNLGR